MVVNGRPLKRMKSRVTADLHDFLTFPSSVTEGYGPFRVNVRKFLTEHALLPPPSSLLPHLLTWQISFRVGELTAGPESGPTVVCVDVVEEDVAKSRSVYCDHCRVVGWSGNPVCSKRYHFIIKADGASIGGYHKPCAGCGDILHLSESRCKTCNHVMTTDDVEDWIYQQLEDTTHLLHGVIHVNGYGHLLRVNGSEGGSRILSGCHIMNFWDRICKALGVRKVSVMDVSKKYGLEYRLLHAITKGHPWYGEWGYEFGSGSFALTLDAYKSAVEALSGMPLSVFLTQGKQQPTRLQDRISLYQSLSELQVVNIRELFSYLLSLIHTVDKSSSWVNTTGFKRQGPSGISHTWGRSDIERVNGAMFRVLRALSGSKWASSRALRGAVCRVAPPDLLDHCLNEIGGKSAADGMVVHTRQNPVSGALEFRLEPRSPPEVFTCGSDSSVIKSPCPSLEVLMQDLRFFYETILHPQTMLSCAREATRDLVISSAEKLLDCKQFVKEYKPERQASLNPSIICLSCQVELSDESDKFAPNPPPELIILPFTASVADLKHEASRAFQDVYLMFKRFEAEELLGFSGVDDSTQVKLLLGSTESVLVRGRSAGKPGISKYRMERGTERWTVDCICGAKDDDGERMLACDVCGVWQHTRCSGIHDSDSVPARFVCHQCRGFGHVSKVNGQCKDEKVTVSVGGNSSSFGKSFTTDDVC